VCSCSACVPLGLYIDDEFIVGQAKRPRQARRPAMTVIGSGLLPIRPPTLIQPRDPVNPIACSAPRWKDLDRSNSLTAWGVSGKHGSIRAA
jgi:hypothetical protein